MKKYKSFDASKDIVQLKTSAQISLDKLPSLLFALFFTIVALGVTVITADRYPSISGDSLSYLDFSGTRSSFYPYILDSLGRLSDDLGLVFVLQSSVYLTSFFTLIFLLHFNFNSILLTFIFGFGISLNIWYQGYHCTILTESLCFSLLNFFICLELVYFNKNKIMYFILSGLLIGLMVGLKPALITFIITGGILICCRLNFDTSRIIKPLLIYIVSFTSVILMENALYNQHHDKRESLLPNLVFGKALILTTSENFTLPQNLPPEQITYLEAIDDLCHEVEVWLRNETPYLIRRELISELEVFGQFNIEPIIEDRYGLTPLTKEEMFNLGIQTIKTNFPIYVKHSLENIIGMWSVDKFTFGKIFMDQSIPKMEDNAINQIFPGWNTSSNNYIEKPVHRYRFQVSMIIFMGFLSLGIGAYLAFFHLSTRLLVPIVKQDMKMLNLRNTIFGILFTAHVNLIFIAFVNIPTVRYTLLLYPLFTLTLLLYVFSYLKQSLTKLDSA